MQPSPSTPAAAASASSALVPTSIVSHLQRSSLYRDYQQAFEATTGLPLALRPAGSFQTPLHGSRQVNPFCALMATANKTCASCLELQQRVEQSATTEAKTLQCFAGLSESAVPVRVGENVLGYLQTGQVFLQALDAADLLAQGFHLLAQGIVLGLQRLVLAKQARVLRLQDVGLLLVQEAEAGHGFVLVGFQRVDVQLLLGQPLQQAVALLLPVGRPGRGLQHGNRFVLGQHRNVGVRRGDRGNGGGGRRGAQRARRRR